jgi:hypothetical protein
LNGSAESGLSIVTVAQEGCELTLHVAGVDDGRSRRRGHDALEWQWMEVWSAEENAWIIGGQFQCLKKRKKSLKNG